MSRPAVPARLVCFVALLLWLGLPPLAAQERWKGSGSKGAVSAGGQEAVDAGKTGVQLGTRLQSF
jgi:hypothetical protein